MFCECDTTVNKVHLFKKCSSLVVSLCVGFSLAAVLHVEGQNVYYPKISTMAASREGSLSAQCESDLISSSQGSGSLCPFPLRTSTVSVGNRSVVHVSPSSRMHVMFHSC